ncbi:MAG: type III pantothenate kinase [Cyanobacteria bacterium J06639_1]
MKRNLAARAAETEVEAGKPWLAIAIGNSRVLWGLWQGETLQRWNRNEIAPDVEFDRQIQVAGDRVWMAAVGRLAPVLEQWPQLRDARSLKLADTSLAEVYDTLGLDRALALMGAAALWGWPILVIDGGTALTVSAADEAGVFVGGAIAPGLALQARSLHTSTAALPDFDYSYLESVERWARTTAGAIASGVVLGAIATVRSFCDDWRRHYPEGAIAFTGGDGKLLHDLAQIPNSYNEPTLVLRGIAECRALRERKPSVKQSDG